MLAWGTCHPRGEDDDFDGLFVKRNEMTDMASTLKGKPIYVEHDECNIGQVGKIHHAWKTKDSKLNVLFETDPTCFKGALAERLIRHGLCNELSLGHNCKVNFSENDMTVGAKSATEVSIVVKGDRPHTSIRGWVCEGARKHQRSQLPEQDPTPDTEATQYILEEGGKHNANTPRSLMSTTPPTDPVADVSEQTPDTTDTNSEMQDLLEALRSTSETVAKQKIEQEASATRMSELNARVEKYEKVGSERRKRALDGAVKDWVGKMVSTHAKELGPYESQLQELLGAMNQEEAEPMVQMLSCAASASADSTSKLNKAYQDLKEAQSQAQRFKSQIEESQKPAFSDQQDRFKAPAPTSDAPRAPPAPSDAYQRMFARKADPDTQRGGGMMSADPSMWAAIMSRASGMPTGSAMRPAFDTKMYSKGMQNRFQSA